LYDTDRSFSVEELARIAYPEITTIAKKHRVAVLRALDYVQERMLLWFFRTYEARARYFISNGCNSRSYAHCLLRQSWWNRAKTEPSPSSLDAKKDDITEPRVRS